MNWVRQINLKNNTKTFDQFIHSIKSDEPFYVKTT